MKQILRRLFEIRRSLHIHFASYCATGIKTFGVTQKIIYNSQSGSLQMINFSPWITNDLPWMINRFVSHHLYLAIKPTHKQKPPTVMHLISSSFLYLMDVRKHQQTP